MVFDVVTVVILLERPVKDNGERLLGGLPPLRLVVVLDAPLAADCCEHLDSGLDELLPLLPAVINSGFILGIASGFNVGDGDDLGGCKSPLIVSET